MAFTKKPVYTPSGNKKVNIVRLALAVKEAGPVRIRVIENYQSPSTKIEGPAFTTPNDSTKSYVGLVIDQNGELGSKVNLRLDKTKEEMIFY